MDIEVLVWFSSFPAYFPFRTEFELIDGPLQFALVKSDHILARRGSRYPAMLLLSIIPSIVHSSPMSNVAEAATMNQRRQPFHQMRGTKIGNTIPDSEKTDIHNHI